MISSKLLATAALSAAVIGSIGLAYAQTTGTPQPGTTGTMTTPGTMGTADTSGTTTTPSTTSNSGMGTNPNNMPTNPSATGTEPMARADRN